MAVAVAVARVRVRALVSAMKVAVVAVGREMAAAVVVVVAVVVEVEVEVAVAGGVPFGPPHEIKIKSTLDNMLVHLMGDCQNWSKRFRPGFRPESIYLNTI